MLTTNEQDRLRRRLVSAAAAACLLVLAATPAAVAMPLQHSSVGSITIALTRHPTAVTSKTQAKFAWRTTGIVGETRCKLDGAAYTYCRGNPGIYGGLSEGHHTFTVRVRNGYRVTAKASFSWLVDSVAPTDPTVSGGSAGWRSAASVQIRATGSTDASSGLAGYQWRISTDGSAWSAAGTGSTATVKAQGISYVQFRSRDNAGNVSSWQPATNGIANMVRLDRTPPDLPTVLGGSAAWQGVASETVSSSGATDARSGVDHYQYRTSTNGGSTWSAATTGTTIAVSAAGTTIVQFRTTDASGLSSGWAPGSPTAGSTVSIDRTAPTAPTVAGGSLSWQNLASLAITGSGGSDSGGGGLVSPQYRTSTNGGTSWSAASSGTVATITAEGQTLVQFRNVDGAGNGSAWTPASSTASSTARLDRSAPTPPTVSGGSLTCTHSRRTITASGSTDGSGSGVSHYEYRLSTDGGASYGAGVIGSSIQLSTTGSYLVQFRAVDGIGLASAWAPATPGASNTACIS